MQYHSYFSLVPICDLFDVSGRTIKEHRPIYLAGIIPENYKENIWFKLEISRIWNTSRFLHYQFHYYLEKPLIKFGFFALIYSSGSLDMPNQADAQCSKHK